MNFEQQVKNRISENAENDALNSASMAFLKHSIREKYSYNFNWFGRPIIQYPQDMIAMQEIIWRVKPDLIIETGIAHGGSLIMNASYLAMLEYCDAVQSKSVLDVTNPKRKILGIDIDIREQNRMAIEQHPMFSHIDMMQGSSLDTGIIERVYEYADRFKTVLVCLDSNHTHDHVYEELLAYASLVSSGSYCVVFDTVIDDMKDENFSNRPWGIGNNPKTAVKQFLKNNSEFVIDKSIEDKLLITVAPEGYLKRI